jgi:hypothetical protein
MVCSWLLNVIHRPPAVDPGRVDFDEMENPPRGGLCSKTVREQERLQVTQLCSGQPNPAFNF